MTDGEHDVRLHGRRRRRDREDASPQPKRKGRFPYSRRAHVYFLMTIQYNFESETFKIKSDPNPVSFPISRARVAVSATMVGGGGGKMPPPL